MTRHVVPLVSILACCLAGPPVVRGQDRARTAEDLVRLALERNRELLAARQRVNEARGLLRQAGVRPAPAVEVGAATGRPLGTYGEEEYSAAYFQPIETGGKRTKRIAAETAGVSAAEAEVDDRIRQVAFDVRVQAAEASAAQQKADVLSRLVTLTQESVRLTTARVAEGDAAALDEQLLRADLDRTEAQRIVAAGRVRSALASLKRAVGLGVDENVALAAPSSAPDTDLTVDDLRANALHGRPDLRVARLLEAQAVADLAVARAEGAPDLTVSATYAHRNSAFDLFAFDAAGSLRPLRDTDNVLTVGLSVPLFTSGRNRGRVDAAQAHADQARLAREALETAVPQEVDAAFARMQAAKEALALFRRGVVDRSEQNLTVIRQAYGLGQLRALDVVNEQRRLADTELAYVDAETELAEARAELERAVGSDLP